MFKEFIFWSIGNPSRLGRDPPSESKTRLDNGRSEDWDVVVRRAGERRCERSDVSSQTNCPQPKAWSGRGWGLRMIRDAATLAESRKRYSGFAVRSLARPSVRSFEHSVQASSSGRSAFGLNGSKHRERIIASGWHSQQIASGSSLRH
ncbi:hypothetical protein RRF57_004400 [Xylaria bambusicola]|uniref:Uncharacterized protein n=1 Tax=Xylaria bambusicola TaxID=326684 RepID=A0AAN7YX15_9PEZI